jgi:ElaB/YqjD/DUF883 family membrane-anchored ribosome-binding protein
METFFKNMTAEEGTKERLTRDLMTLIHDAEELVKATGGSIADRSKQELVHALTKLKSTCKRVEAEAIQRTHATDRLIRQHPYSALGAAFCVGLLIGVLARK